MNLRVGVFVISSNLIFLAAALAFFVLLSYQRLSPQLRLPRVRSTAVLALVSCSGILGAWIYGSVGVMKAPVSPGVPPSMFEFSFGSFGGYWGVLLGSLFASAILGTPYLRLLDVFIPGTLAGGAIARIADVFTRDTSRLTVSLPSLPWGQPPSTWACYDVSIHVFALLIVWRLTGRHGAIPGIALCVFLLGYGPMRWLIEFLRVAPHVFGPFTSGQVMAITQTLVGAGLALYLWGQSRKTNTQLALN